MAKLTFVVAVNNRSVFENNFRASPCFREGHPFEIIVQEDFASASRAYNDALRHSSNDLIIFCHQDIYFPENWLRDLAKALNTLEGKDPNWGVLGCSGMTVDRQHWRYLYSSGLGVSGRALEEPKEVQTLDEIVLIMRRSSGITFDDSLPHFHLYGTDVCLRASELGLRNYVISAFCIHNTHQPLVLPSEFYECCKHVKRRWRDALPIQTTCVRISPLSFSLHARRIREIYLKYIRKKEFGARRLATVEPLLRQCAAVLEQSRVIS